MGQISEARKLSDSFIEVLNANPLFTVRFFLKDIALAVMGMVTTILSVSIMTILVVFAYIQNFRLFSNWWRFDRLIVNSFKLMWTLIKRMDSSKEACVMDERYYAERYGFCFEKHEVVTEDGFILQIHRVFKPSINSSTIPIIIQHGLFQCSGIFLINEQDSLAFYLAERGYDVWLGNNRGVFPRHVSLSPKDTKYWDWSLDELAKYDFPTILHYVCQQTKNEKVIYVGHSQGNAQAFLGLSQNPQIANKIRLFVAIAPAFHISPPKHWALRWMVKMSKDSFFFLFGKNCFLPIMCQLQAIANPLIFSSLAFNMFCYLFNWTDNLWDASRKPKYFLFTPRPTSCKLLTHWSDIIRLGTLHLYRNEEGPSKLCNVADIHCPTAIFYSPEDSLVHGDGLVNDMRQKNVDIFHVEKIDKYEHMDLIWAKDSTTTVFSKLVDVLNRA